MKTVIRIATIGMLVAASNGAFAQQAATTTAASSQPLTGVPANVRTQSLAEGEVTHQTQVKVGKGQAPVIVRSIEPSSVAGNYRIDFDALDTDGDGFISRDEAQANPALADEFNSLDTRHVGKLDRADLAGWLTD